MRRGMKRMASFTEVEVEVVVEQLPVTTTTLTFLQRRKIGPKTVLSVAALILVICSVDSDINTKRAQQPASPNY
jgi:hypothetical protein